MGDIGNDFPAQHIQPLQGFSKLSDRVGELPQFILTFQIRSNGKIVLSQLIHGSLI